MKEEETKSTPLTKRFACIAGEFDDKDPCASSDGLCIYEKETGKEGSSEQVSYDAFCWSCGQHFTKEEVHSSSLAEMLGVGPEGVVTSKKTLGLAKKSEPLTKAQLVELKKSIGFTDKPYRGISPETMKFYGHMVKRNSKGVATEIWYPETSDQGVTGFKIRILPKSFNKMGSTGVKSQLSGQYVYKNHGSRILYVGGENDKCAARQALAKYDVHVVSPTTGEGSAAKQAAAQYAFFDKYDEIYIGMDNDEAGQKATEEILKVLPAAKLKIVKWSAKDPHKLLEDQKEKRIVDDFFRAKSYVQTGIKSSTELMSDVQDVLLAEKITLPSYMHKLETMMKRAFSTNGRVVNIIGDTSCGKSTHVNNMVYHWIFAENMKPLILSLEMTGGEYAVDLLSLHLKKNLDWFKEGMDAWEYLQREDVKQLHENLFYDENYNERFKIIDDREGNVETLKKLIEMGVKQSGCNIVIIDVLSDFIRFLPKEEQEMFMNWEKNFVKSGVSIVNVLHTRKPERNKEGKMVKTTEYDVLGSGSQVQSAHINIVINRDKMSPDPFERNITYVDMPKCRRGSTGPAGEWYYHGETRQVYDKDDFLSLGLGVPVYEQPSEADKPSIAEVEVFGEIVEGVITDDCVYDTSEVVTETF